MIARRRLLPSSRAGARIVRTLAGSAIVATIAFGLPTGVARSQRLLIPRGAGEAEIVAAAEHEGVTFPRVSSTQPNAAIPRTCVAGFEMGPAQSGDFVIGGNLGGTAAMFAGQTGKVWWAPLHAARDMPALVVRGRSLTVSGDTVRFTTSRIASGTTGVPVAETERKYFFPSGITIPRPGKWLLIATSGANWGCFILTVR